jgi:hypothetical protein
MALKAQITTEEFQGLSEHFQAEYKAGQDGKSYTIDVLPVNGFDLQNVGGLTSALEKERSNVSALTGQVARFGDLDPTTAREAIAKMADFSSGKLDDKQQAAYDAKLQEVTRKHETDIGTKDSRIGLLSKMLGREMVESKAAVLMAEKEIGGNPTLLMPHILREARVVEDGDKFRVSIVDPSTGHERVSTAEGRTGSPMILKELLIDMRSRNALAAGFAAPDSRGTDSNHANRHGGNQTGSHNISKSDARDIGKYRMAKAAAEKAGATLTILD